MTTRKGLGKGMGCGYKNLIPHDPMVHKQSALGMKQPQMTPAQRIASAEEGAVQKIATKMHKENLEKKEKAVLKRVEQTFREKEKAIVKDLKSRPLADQHITITYGYVPAWRDLFSSELDDAVNDLKNEDNIEAVGYIWDEMEERLGDKGILIIGDEGDGTVLHAMTQKYYDKYWSDEAEGMEHDNSQFVVVTTEKGRKYVIAAKNPKEAKEKYKQIWGDWREKLSARQTKDLSKVQVYDNGGETADRYTVKIGTSIIGMSDDPLMPDGFNQYAGEVSELPAWKQGKKISLDKLNASVLTAIYDRMHEHN